MGAIFHFLRNMCLFYKGMIKEFFVGRWKAFVSRLDLEPPLKAKHIKTSEIEAGMHVHLSYKDPKSLGIQTRQRLTYTRFNPDEVNDFGTLFKGRITKIEIFGPPLNEKMIEFSFFKEDGTPRKLLLLEHEIEKVIKIDN